MRALINILVVALSTTILVGCQSDDEPVNPATNAPIANAGDDRQVEIGSVINLDASGSTDPQNDSLTYNWSFVSRPAGSAAAIIGVAKEQAEFTLDRAGVYEIQLMVSDGTFEAADDLLITNRTPVLNQVETPISTDLGEGLAERGRVINLSGGFFSPEADENSVTLGGVICPIMASDTDLIKAEVSENAVSGDLVIQVGEESVTWPVTIKIVSRPVTEFINNDNTLEEQRRLRADYKEVGTIFKPVISGSVVGFIDRIPAGGIWTVRVTLWDVANKTVLAAKTYDTTDPGLSEKRVSLDIPVPLEAGKEYLITLNSNLWYFHIHNPRKPIYPQTLGNFEVLGSLSTDSDIGTTDLPTNHVYPERIVDDYIVLGADIVFAADPQQ